MQTDMTRGRDGGGSLALSRTVPSSGGWAIHELLVAILRVHLGLYFFVDQRVALVHQEQF